MRFGCIYAILVHESFICFGLNVIQNTRKGRYFVVILSGGDSWSSGLVLLQWCLRSPDQYLAGSL